MQKQFYLLVLFFHLVFISESKAQEGWFWQNPYPTGFTLYGVSFSDENNGTAVGEYGAIIRTTNGGNSWIVQESGTTKNLRSVSFPDPNNGTAVGDNGIILHTTNGGTTWKAQSSGTAETLYGVSFPDANNGTAVGLWTTVGTVFHTTDGGDTWVPQQTSTTGSNGVFISVSFADVNNGTIVGNDGIIEHTTDGGNSWLAQNSGTTHTLDGVSFLDVNNGIAVGLAGTIIKTTDAGASWTKIQFSSSSDLLDVSFTNINFCLIVGINHTVVKLTSTSWTRYYLDGTGNFYGASFNTIVGVNGQIFCTTDSGTNWDSQRTGPTRTLIGISLTNENVGTVVGDGGTILRTTDGGNNWTLQPYSSPTIGGSLYDYLNDVSFSDDNNGFIAGGYFHPLPGVATYDNGLILHTSDGGTNWQSVYNYSQSAFRGISCPSTNTCIAVGYVDLYDQSSSSWIDHACWVITKNGGINWANRYFGSITDPLTDVSFINDNIGVLVGYNGRILRTTDGADSWHIQTSGTTKNLQGVCFIDANNGVVVGNDGTILKTINGGTTWTPQTSGTSEDLYGVHLTDKNNGKIAGSNGTILYTTNGGTNWLIQEVYTDEDLFAVSFANDKIGNVAGDNGTILRTTNGGITSISEYIKFELPTGFTLSQNYPNPFNPTTKIRYTIPNVGTSFMKFVKIKVFDILGREVATLVNEEKPAGNYEVEFNARSYGGSNLSSGVYFYRMQAGDFRQTKKMILLR